MAYTLQALRAFDRPELVELKQDVKDEIRARISGKVTSVSKNGRSTGIQTMSQAELMEMLADIERILGRSKRISRTLVQPRPMKF